jgi:hypothetical protein
MYIGAHLLDWFLFDVGLKVRGTPWARIESCQCRHEISHVLLILVVGLVWIPGSLYIYRGG